MSNYSTALATERSEELAIKKIGKSRFFYMLNLSLNTFAALTIFSSAGLTSAH